MRGSQVRKNFEKKEYLFAKVIKKISRLKPGARAVVLVSQSGSQVGKGVSHLPRAILRLH